MNDYSKDCTIRLHEWDKFSANFELAYPRPATKAQLSQWKFKRDMAWQGWRWARLTPYVEPQSSLTRAYFHPMTPDVFADMANDMQ